MYLINILITLTTLLEVRHILLYNPACLEYHMINLKMAVIKIYIYSALSKANLLLATENFAIHALLFGVVSSA